MLEKLGELIGNGGVGRCRSVVVQNKGERENEFVASVGGGGETDRVGEDPVGMEEEC